MRKNNIRELFAFSFCIMLSLACGILANALALSLFDFEITDFFPLKNLDKFETFVFIVTLLSLVIPFFLSLHIAEYIDYWYDYWKPIIFIPIVALLSAFLGMIIWFIVGVFIEEGPVIAILVALFGGAISAPTIYVIRIFFN